MDSQSVHTASFRYSGTVSDLKPNTNYAVMFCPTTGGGCGSSTTFTTDGSGNASFKEPKDSSYSGIGINYSTSDPIRAVKIGDTSQNPYLAVLSGDFNFFR